MQNPINTINTSHENISIDFSICYESFPCKHNVSWKSTNPMGGQVNGGKNSRLMSGPEICNLIVEQNLNVSYDDMAHFAYCFTSPAHGEYL